MRVAWAAEEATPANRKSAPPSRSNSDSTETGEPMIYVGCDPSTRRLDLAGVTPDGDWLLASVPVSIDSIVGRRLRDDLRNELDSAWWDEVVCLWIERPHLRQNRHTFRQLCTIVGAFAASIPRHVVVDTIDPTVWRQEIGIPVGKLKRDETKQLALLWALETLPDDARSALTFDLAEAAAIAWTCFKQSERAAA